MSKIVLAIILFNIAMGLWAKRKKKKEEEAAGGGSGTGGVDAKEEARQRIEGMRARAEAAQARANSERETREGRDDGETAARAAAQAKKGKAVDVGKDILGQLAKELGLELPQQQAPRPALRPQPAPAAQAQAAKAKAKAARAQESSTPRASAGRMAHDENVREADARAARRAQSEHSSGEEGGRSLKDLLAAQKAAASREGENAPRRAKSDFDDAPVGARVAGPMIRREEIIDPAAMRRAFVLQTILEKPLSLRRSEGG